MNIKSKEDVYNAIENNNIKFIRLQFTDIQGVVKDVEIPVSQVKKPSKQAFPLTVRQLKDL